jgi:ribonuclease Z
MATLELITLGTGSPIHQPIRYGNSQVISGGDVNILVDAGWGATIRLFQANMPPQRIDAVFITHLHSDHTTDLADFLVMGWVGGRQQAVPIYGPEGTARTVAGYEQALEKDADYRFAHHGEKLPPTGPKGVVTEITAGVEPVEVATIGDITVKAFEVDHRPVMPAFGYRFERAGKSIVISGDTNTCPGLLRGSQEADILVCDSMNVAMMEQLEGRLRGIGNETQASLLADAHDYHTSVQEAAALAQHAGVKHFVMSHLLPPITMEQVPQFTAGLDEIFTGKMSVANDLDHFVVE